MLQQPHTTIHSSHGYDTMPYGCMGMVSRYLLYGIGEAESPLHRRVNMHVDIEASQGGAMSSHASLTAAFVPSPVINQQPFPVKGPETSPSWTSTQT
jgi:hypothetical protein